MKLLKEEQKERRLLTRQLPGATFEEKLVDEANSIMQRIKAVSEKLNEIEKIHKQLSNDYFNFEGFLNDYESYKMISKNELNTMQRDIENAEYSLKKLYNIILNF